MNRQDGPDDPKRDPPDRRAQAERRLDRRGGRRREDWPDDAGITGCPRCGFAHPQVMAISASEYQWACSSCGRSFLTKRATRMVL